MNSCNNAKEIQDVRTKFLPFGEVRRDFSFNAFNCMKAYSFDGERFGYYGYDASGERTYKIDFDATFSKENGVISVQSLDVEKMTLYPNGYVNINQNGEYTKHYYADALRIASKIGSGFTGNICDSATTVDFFDYINARITFVSEIMEDELNEVVVPTQNIQQINPIPYPTFCNLGPGGQETNLFFYHPDHLGSTGMVTDNNANVTQGLFYAPFGEIISDYNPSFHDTLMPNFAFNAKELDEENGMYYYSARYYAPPTFISRDPMFEKYPSISPYTYCANNPMKFVDPTGESMEEGDGDPPKNGQYSPSNIKSNTAVKVPYAIPATETKTESKTPTAGSNTNTDNKGVVSKALTAVKNFDASLDGHSDPANRGTITKQDVIVGTAVVGTLASGGLLFGASSAIEAIIAGVGFFNNIDNIGTNSKGESASQQMTDNPTTKNVINYTKTAASVVGAGSNVIGFKDASTTVQIFRAIDIGTSTAGTVASKKK